MSTPYEAGYGFDTVKKRPVIGIDPGRDGGAVWLAADGRTVLDAWRWRYSTKKGHYNVRVAHGHRYTVAALSEIGNHLAQRAIVAQLEGRPILCIEGFFVPRVPKGKKPDAKYYGQVARIVTLGEYAGQVYGPCNVYASEVLRPTAGVWRPMILGIPPNTDSKTAEGAAIVACTRIKPPLVRGLGELGTDPHVAEAACIARYGWLMQRGPDV